MKRLDQRFAFVFESVDLMAGRAKCKTLFSDLANRSERTKRIEQIQKARVSRPKLTLERIGFRTEELRDLFRVLKLAGHKQYRQKRPAFPVIPI